MLRIGIFGGSFSPIHIGHISAAEHFMSRMWLDVLFVIPTGESPAKGEHDVCASAEDRLEMCRRAFSGKEGVIVSDMEIVRGGKSYTADTLRHLSGDDVRLFLLLVTDKILTLDRWRDVDEIFKLSYPVYIRRDSDASADELIVEKVTELRNRYGKNIVRIDAPVIELSSSEIRQKIARGESVSGLVPDGVFDYVRERGLYGSQNNS